MTQNNQFSNEDIPEKVVGVSNWDDRLFRIYQLEHPFSNSNEPYDIVNDLQYHFNISIKGSDREITEMMARLHKKGLPATNKGLESLFKNSHSSKDSRKKPISLEYIRKRMRYLQRQKIVKAIDERNGHGNQYVLVNMLDRVIGEKQSKSANSIRIVRKEKEQEVVQRHDEFNLINALVLLIRNKPEPKFHHITLKSKLKFPQEDYKRIKLTTSNIIWNLPSSKNQALIHKGKISLRRTFELIVYPNGTVMITIGSSKEPYKWYSRDDWLDLIEACGSIHQILKDSLGVSEPLIHSSVSQWNVSQLDIGYDCELDNCGSANRLNISRLFNGAVKVKHLDGVYQIYNKHLPFDGEIIRIEDQRYFKSKNDSSLSSISLSELKEKVKPKSITELLCKIFPY